MKRKNLSSRCSSHVWQDARENIDQKELFIWVMSPVGVEPTTDCLGEMLTASPPEDCTAL